MSDEFIREIRINPIVPAESVLVSTERSKRPRSKEEPAPRDSRRHVESCPFCRGNEALTPPEILRVPVAGEWQVRMVRNLYPVLGDDHSDSALFFGVQRAIDGYGRHEVIIDHADHGMVLHHMAEEHLAVLLGVYRDRMRALFDKDARLRFILVFKNFGPAAGASIPHTHSQLIAMPVVPRNIQDEVDNSRAYFQKTGKCIFCSLIDEALTLEATVYDRTSGKLRRRIDVGQYIVERSDHFIAIKPFASRFEWEIHILPLRHSHDFLDVSQEELADFARVLRRSMARLDAVVGDVQYNYFLHSAPRHAGPEVPASYHWHLEICPRTSIPNGFEIGSGLFVNTISPEDAARRLREVII
ncbi:MAG: DUF4931 domain-containing protein [Proteobacteria bacterium]|nr:DUF4931 domain-containing protein [Pseudomonadota bacterium]MBU1641648.1 DUF4931 domain-containing protein [Pseudomonadota bacterium]